MTRRELMEKRRRHRRIMRIRKIIKIAIYAVLALLAVLLVSAIVRAVAKGISGRKTEENPVIADEGEEPNPDGNTAVRRALAITALGTNGWNLSDDGWWYQNDDNTQFASGWQTIDGQKYYFNDEGYIATGWTEIDGLDYYFRESGVQDPTAKLKYVALTYDDGPSANTDRILDVLTQYNAKATFFVVGTQAEYYTGQLQREAELGMEIGSHTYNHDTLYGSSAEDIKKTMQKNQETIKNLCGVDMQIMRPTGGGYDATVRENVGLPMIIWDVDTLDWDHKNPETTEARIMAQIQDGSVILMHDLWQATATASESFIPKLYEMGYKMVTVSELAKKRGITLEDGVPYYTFYPEDAVTTGES